MSRFGQGVLGIFRLRLHVIEGLGVLVLEILEGLAQLFLLLRQHGQIGPRRGGGATFCDLLLFLDRFLHEILRGFGLVSELGDFPQLLLLISNGRRLILFLWIVESVRIIGNGFLENLARGNEVGQGAALLFLRFGHGIGAK